MVYIIVQFSQPILSCFGSALCMHSSRVSRFCANSCTELNNPFSSSSPVFLPGPQSPLFPVLRPEGEGSVGVFALNLTVGTIQNHEREEQKGKKQEEQSLCRVFHAESTPFPPSHSSRLLSSFGPSGPADGPPDAWPPRPQAALVRLRGILVGSVVKRERDSGMSASGFAAR